jgi:serine/threonine protein kinase
MSLAAGDKLGPYEIISLIGKGGMGEVYRAHDTRLGRDVAIKISAAKFSQRFEREARAIAGLNHPHICSLYDVGQILVMEHVDGAPLRGPLSLGSSAALASQLCDALDAAHRKGSSTAISSLTTSWWARAESRCLISGWSKSSAPSPDGATGVHALTSEGSIMVQFPTWREQIEGARKLMPAPTFSPSGGPL